MPTSQLTPQGLQTPTLQEIKSQIEAALLAAPGFGPNSDLSETSPLGQLVAIFANQISLNWEGLQALYNGFNPDTNSGTVQDSVAAITGTTRRPSSPYRTVHDLTLAAGTYAAGTLVIRPTGTTTTQRAQNLLEVTSGGGLVADVVFEALDPGLTAITTATVFEIASPVVGFTDVSSPTAVTNGRNIESDSELRLRREQEATGTAGSTTVDAIRAAILGRIPTVITATVYENPTDTIDSNGVLPYSVEAVVHGPTSPTPDDDERLANVIYESKGGGIRASGSDSVMVLDSQGNPHNIGFSRPEAIEVRSVWNLRVIPGIYNESAVKEAISTYAPMRPGQELQWTAFLCSARVAGVRDVVDMEMAIVGDPLARTNIQPTVREYITMQDDNIILNVNPG